MSLALLVVVLVPAQLPGEPVFVFPPMPPVEDRLRFPQDAEFVRNRWQRANASSCYFETHRPMYPSATVGWSEMEAERIRLKWACRAWYQLDDVVCGGDEDARRNALRNLREVLGPELYYQGYMPPPWGTVGPLKVQKEW